jgi:hypothetical protein
LAHKPDRREIGWLTPASLEKGGVIVAHMAHDPIARFSETPRRKSYHPFPPRAKREKPQPRRAGVFGELFGFARVEKPGIIQWISPA